MDTVLPSIRKFGAYIMPDTLEEMISSPDFTIALLQELQKEREKNAELAPKAKFYDRILQSPKLVPISLVAKDLYSKYHPLHLIIANHIFAVTEGT